MPYDFTTRIDRGSDGAEKWNAMYAAKPDVAPGTVPLSVADMEFPTAPEVVDALDELIHGHVLGYTVPNDAYVDAAVGWQTRRHGWTPERDWLYVTPGVVPAVYAAVRALTRPGEGVIVQRPVYYPFMGAVRSAGRELVDSPLRGDASLGYSFDLDDLAEKASDPRNTMLVLCSPHNPVGRVWSPEELRALLDVCIANDVFVVADEIHDDLVMPGHEHTTLMSVMSPLEWGCCMVCTAPSKTFNLAGAQCSNIYIPNAEVRHAVARQFDELGLGMVNAFGLAACRAAYERGEAWLEELLAKIWENYLLLRDTLAEGAPELVVAPLEGTYLAWVDCRAWGLGAEALESLMHEHDLFLDEGRLFGPQGEGFERINLACPTDVVADAARRLLEARADVQSA